MQSERTTSCLDESKRSDRPVGTNAPIQPEWVETVKARLNRKNKVLFRLDDEILSDLAAMLEASSRKAVVLWAFELAEQGVTKIEERIPDDDRARESLELSKLWARGDVKMPAAKSAILGCHGAAKDTDDEASIALYHAVGQACGCVHTPGHALGFPIYELTAIVRKLGIDNCAQAVLKRISEYEAALVRCQEEALSHPGPWACFLE